MKQKQRILTASILSVLSVACLAGGFGGVVASAGTAEETPTPVIDTISFKMKEGAGARYNLDLTGDDRYEFGGLRFIAEISPEDITKLENAYTDINYGVVIAPLDCVKLAPLTAENLFGESAKYYWTDDNQIAEGEEIQANKKQIIHHKSLLSDDEESSNKVVMGAIVDILPDNLTREFVGVAYIAYKDGTAQKYEMAEYYGGDVDNNTRSVAYVAQCASEDTTDSTLSGWLTDSYVTPVTATEASYSIEYYFEQPDGSFVADESLTETKTGLTVADGVSTEAKAAEGLYVFDESNENNKLSGSVYANDRLVLKSYYAYDWDKITVTETEYLQEATANGAFDLTALIPDGSTSTYNTFANACGAQWSLAPVYGGGTTVTPEAATVDFSDIELRYYNVTATVTRNEKEYTLYNGLVDFYDPSNVLEWNDVVESEFAFENETNVASTKYSAETVTNAPNKTGTYLSFSTEETVLVTLLPKHSKTYYETQVSADVNLYFDYYLYAQDASGYALTYFADTNYDGTYNNWGYQRLVNTWNTEYLPMQAFILNYWEKGLMSGKATGTGTEANGCFMGFKTGTNGSYVAYSNVYMGNVRILPSSFESTTIAETLIEREAYTAEDKAFTLNSLLSDTQKGYTKYGAYQWTLTPALGGESITVSGSENLADLATLENQAYTAQASLMRGTEELAVVIESAVIDFYNASETLEWNDDMLLEYFDFEKIGAGTATTATAEIVTDAPNRSGEKYLEVSSSVMITLLPKHSKSYYSNISSTDRLYFDIYMQTDDSTVSAATIYYAGANETFTNYRYSYSTNQWLTMSISLENLVNYWNYIVLTKGVDADAAFNGSYASQCGMIGGIASTGTPSFTGYMGNFRILPATIESTTIADTQLLDKSNSESQAFKLNDLLSDTQMSYTKYVPIVWTLTAAVGGRTVTVDGSDALLSNASLEKRAYTAVATLGDKTICTATVDIYDSADGLVWNDSLSLTDAVVYDTTTLSLADSVPTNTDGSERLGTYYKAYAEGTSVFFALKALHSKDYYQLFASQGYSLQCNYYYEATADETNLQGKYSGSFGYDPNSGTGGWKWKQLYQGVKKWATITMSLDDYLLANWDTLGSTYGFISVHFNAYTTNSADGTISTETCTLYIGNFSIVQA